MSITTVLELLDGEARTKVKNLIKKEDDAVVRIGDDGIYVFNSKTLVVKITVSYYMNHRRCL